MYYGRRVSFIDDDVLVSCLGNKLEVFQVNKDEVIRSRRVNGEAMCLSVRERREIFIGFYQSHKITVYDAIDLNEIKSIFLQGIQDGCWPYDMTAIADRIFVCLQSIEKEGHKSSLIFEEKSGNILSELIKPTSTSSRFIDGITANTQLSVVVIAVFDYNGAGQQLIFYSLLNENNCSFLIVEVESDVTRIRISDRGDRMITGDFSTGEVKVYDNMTEFCSYSRLKQNLMSKLQKDVCVKLIKYFALPSHQSDIILRSAAPAENLLLALEETGVLQPANVDRLIEAFSDLTVDSTCLYLVDFYKKTRMQVTSYDRFLAALSTHLTASLPGDLCEYFNISDEKKKSIASSQNPGLTLLLALDEMGFITSYKVESLERALTEMQLIQAVAKIHEYQSIVEEVENLPQEKDITAEGKKTLFIQCLQERIKSWYETMTPVPWKKSCRWRCTDLFIGRSLLLTDKKAKETFAPADAHHTTMADIKVLYTELFSHEKLKSETQIIIKGDPGSGKTMLMSQLAYDWCQGKFKKIDILILLPLKCVERKTIVQTIKEFYFPGEEGLSLSDIEYFLLNEETSKCLLLDGLEEFNGIATKEEEVKVVTIMSQVKFPSCKVVTSSRSGYAKHLPNSVELKLAKFNDIERNAYIQKVFPDSPEKQKEVKKVIKENVFLHDLCSSPLLFVLLVHNMESLVNLDIAQINKVAPFMKNVLCSLHSLGKVMTQIEESGPGYKKQDEVVLEELAYNGLCGKYQQLSWPKEVIEFKVSSIREWIATGVLVVEENIIATVPLMRRGHHLPKTGPDDVAVTKEKEDSESLVPGATAEPQPDDDSGVKSPAEPESSEVQVTTTESRSTKARYVPLQIRFAHKIIQEWFAANYLSSMISRLRNAEYIQKHLTEKLLFVNSSDLRFFLWFTVALYPTCCPYILKYLLSSNRAEEGNLPKHVMDYIFLCFSECDGEQVHGIQAAVTDVCKEEITVHPDDSRLVQQAKVAMLELASKCGIMCRKLILANIVNSATGDTLHFTSGVSVNVLDTLEVLEVSDCNKNLTDDDCANVLEFIKTCDWLKDICLKISKPPPSLEKDTIDHFRESGKTIIWTMGPDQKQRLNTVTGEWMIEIGESSTSFEIGTNRNFGWGEKTILEAEDTISKEGGPLEIPDTGFKIDIPPDALQEGLEECNICMKIVPPDVSDETDTEFTSNSSATVELLPNNLTFQEPFELTLPHSLQLKKGAEYKAKIFVSHHEEGACILVGKRKLMHYMS
ncbi:Protein NLRC5 [Holothuria leucospilota]|uniref:Protein NLRC5 n=1 Tax=Holothuria leucospilota TaxID=206669 RepID=A0A9Q1H6L2_HOLLE|nr:Protein NLRC5 [Holothuria leucospilota]